MEQPRIRHRDPERGAGKGSRARKSNKAKLDAGHTRIFGERKPWWEIRDEAAPAQPSADPRTP